MTTYKLCQLPEIKKDSVHSFIHSFSTSIHSFIHSVHSFKDIQCFIPSPTITQPRFQCFPLLWEPRWEMTQSQVLKQGEKLGTKLTICEICRIFAGRWRRIEEYGEGGSLWYRVCNFKDDVNRLLMASFQTTLSNINNHWWRHHWCHQWVADKGLNFIEFFILLSKTNFKSIKQFKTEFKNTKRCVDLSSKRGIFFISETSNNLDSYAFSFFYRIIENIENIIIKWKRNEMKKIEWKKVTNINISLTFQQ